MATQAIAGYNAQLLIEVSTGVSTAIGEMKDVTLTVEADEIDVTSHNFNGWKASIPGARKWSCTADALYVASDTVQDKLYDALVASTILKVKFQPKVGSTMDEWTGDAYIIHWELAGPTDDAAAISIELSGAGPLTKATQT